MTNTQRELKRKIPIIFEGPDGSGKSTLAKRIGEPWGMAPFHHGGVPSSGTEIMRRSCEIVQRTQEGKVIFDRHTLISEQVYGHALRNKVLIPAQIGEFILKTMQPVIVYVRPTDELLVTRRDFVLNDETKGWNKPAVHRAKVIENHEKIIRMYDDYMAHLDSFLMVLRIDPMDEHEVGLLQDSLTGILFEGK